jgi:hypothetical protein
MTFTLELEEGHRSSRACGIPFYNVTFTTIDDPLALSIAVWEERCRIMDEYKHIWTGISSCALCKKFRFPGNGNSCYGCDVAIYTGCRYCKETPYEEVSDTADRLYRLLGDHYDSEDYKTVDIKTLPEFQQVWAALRTACDAELAFLKMLQEKSL